MQYTSRLEMYWANHWKILFVGFFFSLNASQDITWFIDPTMAEETFNSVIWIEIQELFPGAILI